MLVSSEFGLDFTEALALDTSTIDLEFTSKELGKFGIGIALALGLDDAGATPIQGNLYSAFQKCSELPTSREIEASVASVRRVRQLTGKRGITLGLEVFNRYETNVLNTCKRQSPSRSLSYEHRGQRHCSGHCRNRRVPRLFPHTGLHPGYLGSGSIDFARAFGSLAESDYQSPITLSPFRLMRRDSL